MANPYMLMPPVYSRRRPDEEEDLPTPSFNLGPDRPLSIGEGGGAAPAAPGVTVQMPGPPARSERIEQKGAQKDVRYKQQSPQSAADLEQMDIAGQEAERARQVRAETRDPVAEANIIGEEKQAIVRQLAEARKREAIEAAQPEINARMEAHAQASKEMAANRKFSDYWEDKSTPVKLLAAVLVGLNEYARQGRGMGGPNMAWEIFQHAAERDRQQKLAKFQASKEFVELKKEDVGAAQEALKGKLKQFDDESVSMGKAYAQQTKALAERLGKPAAIAAAEETDAKAKAQEAETRLKQRREYERDVTEQGARRDSSVTINTGGGGDSGARVVPALNGKPAGVVADKNVANKLTEQWSEVHALRRDGMALDAFLKEHGGKPLDPALQRERDNLLQAFVGHLTKERGTLTLQKEEWERYSNTFTPGYLESMVGKRDNPIINQVINSAGQKYNDDLKGHGVTGQGAPAPAPTPQGAAPPKQAPERKASKPTVRTKQIGGKRYVNDGRGWIELE